MPSSTETALAALHTVLQGIVGPQVKRNEEVDDEVLAGGLLNLGDGSPGEPETTLSPLTYHYEHVAELEVVVMGQPDAIDAAWDALLQGVSTAINADTTLGGAVERTIIGRPEEPEIDRDRGTKPAKSGIVPITLFYSTNDPLN